MSNTLSSGFPMKINPIPVFLVAKKPSTCGLGLFCSKKHSHGFIFIGNPDSGCLPILCDFMKRYVGIIYFCLIVIDAVTGGRGVLDHIDFILITVLIS